MAEEARMAKLRVVTWPSQPFDPSILGLYDTQAIHRARKRSQNGHVTALHCVVIFGFEADDVLYEYCSIYNLRAVLFSH